MFFATTAMAQFAPYWTVWIIMLVVGEILALHSRQRTADVNNNGGTFSELVWWLIRGSTWWHRLLFVSALAFFIDLGLHFFVGSQLL